MDIYIFWQMHRTRFKTLPHYANKYDDSFILFFNPLLPCRRQCFLILGVLNVIKEVITNWSNKLNLILRTTQPSWSMSFFSLFLFPSYNVFTLWQDGRLFFHLGNLWQSLCLCSVSEEGRDNPLRGRLSLMKLRKWRRLGFSTHSVI